MTSPGTIPARGALVLADDLADAAEREAGQRSDAAVGVALSGRFADEVVASPDRLVGRPCGAAEAGIHLAGLGEPCDCAELDALPLRLGEPGLVFADVGAERFVGDLPGAEVEHVVVEACGCLGGGNVCSVLYAWDGVK